MIGASDRRVRLVTVAVGVAGILAGLTATASAQDISVNFGQGNGLTERVIQLVALLTVLSAVTRFVILVFSVVHCVALRPNAVRHCASVRSPAWMRAMMNRAILTSVVGSPSRYADRTRATNSVVV